MTKQTKKKKKKKTHRNRYSKQFRDEALALAERVGVSTAAKELAILKDGSSVLCEAPEGKYVTKEHTGKFWVFAMSWILKTSRSGFYSWCRREYQTSLRQRRRQELDEAVKKASTHVRGLARQG
jgi:hypothetical protein